MVSKVRHWPSCGVVFGDWDAELALKESRRENLRM
jgi:hypothetical protein